jgi:hypothetical protein
VNYALEEFVAELKAQGTFDNVVIVTHSDFARTLTPNSNAGTDHGWSGIQMAAKLTNGSIFFPHFPAFSLILPGIFSICYYLCLCLTVCSRLLGKFGSLKMVAAW